MQNCISRLSQIKAKVMNESAIETYLDLLYDYSDLEESEVQEAYEQFLTSYKDRFEIRISEIKELFPNLYLTHIESYENPCEDRLKSRTSHMVIVEDTEHGRAIIVDGNHLWNSFKESSYNIKILVVEAPVPKSVCTYKA